MSLCLSCPICSENYTNNDIIYSTYCGHVFHFHCMQQWQSRSTSCPQCRSYNIQSHKIYLNLENTAENDQKFNEIKSELELSKKKITELEELHQEVENLVEVKSQLELSIKTSSELEQQLEETERDFLNLQGQYNQKEDKMRELERTVNYLNLQSEFRSKENLALKAENLALINARQNPIDNVSNDGSKSQLEIALRERTQILEEKLNQISLELAKEIRNSTDLTVEKIKLQSMLSQYTSGAITMQSNWHSTQLPQQNVKHFRAENTKTNSKPKQLVSKSSDQNQSRTQNSTFGNEILSRQCKFEQKNEVRSVVIKGIAKSETQFPLKHSVLKLAHQMELQITEDDIEDTSLLGRNQHKRPDNISIVVKFKNLDMKVQFLSNKEKLKANTETKNLILHEYVNENTNTLFHYAKVLRSNGYKFVFCKNNAVIAKKDRNSPQITIKTKEEVDKMVVACALVMEFQ